MRGKQRAWRGWAFLAGALLTTGCGAAAYQGPVSDHFDGKHFKNAAPFDERGVLDLLKWKLIDGPAAMWPDEILAVPARPDATAPAGRIRVTLIGHASTLLQMDGLNVLTDPVWSDTVGPIAGLGPGRFQQPGIRFEDLPKIHAVVISHSHFDHLDVPTLRRLAKAHHPRIFAGLGTAAYLRDQGIEGGEDLDWWQSVDLGAVKLTMAPAQHWSQRGLFDRFLLLWGSYYFTGPSGRAYFGGDTALGPHFAQIQQRLGAPDLAMLPIGAYLPRWFMRPQHVSPDEAVQAHVELGARRSVAIHWGTFDQSDEGAFDPVEDLRRALQQRGLPDDVFVARFNGGVVEAPARLALAWVVRRRAFGALDPWVCACQRAGGARRGREGERGKGRRPPQAPPWPQQAAAGRGGSWSQRPPR